MAIYIGFYRFDPEYIEDIGEQVREGEIEPPPPFPEPFATKVREFPEKLPEGCRLIGSYAVVGQSYGDPTAQLPGITIIETEDPSHLQWIIRYYSGYLTWFFHPYMPVERT